DVYKRQVVLKAEICEKLAEVDMTKAVSELKNLKEVVRSCLKDVRRIIYDLRPMSIDDLGLKPTIQKYIEGFSQQYGIECEFRLRGDDNRIKDSNITLAVFRIVQECLNNIRKHAHASQVTIQMECAEKALILRIKDDGRGFDTGSLSEANRNENGGFGLFGMRERIELLEGSFGIESTVGMGTTVRVQLPYDLEGVFA
ncbi:MAG: sensor histidine kinase, partial [Clostridia bacterium]|nr:sensor histidine kinase [Clostridia bacterium]